MKSLIRKKWDRIPILAKMVFFGVTVSLFSIILSDYLSSITVKTAIEKHFKGMLDDKALEFRLNFSRYVHAHSHAVQSFSSRINLIDYIKKQDWSSQAVKMEITSYKDPPQWVPPRTILRTFANPRNIILLDSEGRAREFYNSWDGEIPEDLKHPTKRMLNLSNNISYLTSLDETPSLVTSKEILDSDKNRIGYMILSSPFDQEFINASQGQALKSFVVTLVSEVPERILVSSDPTLVEVNQSLDELEDDFFILKQEFFEYGSSDMVFKFVAFLPKSKIHEVMGPISQKDRLLHLVLAFIFTALFSLVIYYIVRRIGLMTKRIELFSTEILGGTPKGKERGDELYNLEERFQLLTEEVKTANSAVQKKAEELVKSEAQLVQAEKLSAMGQMAGGLAHELNSPLAGLLPMIEKYRDISDEDSEAHNELSLMLKACEHMARIVKDFSTFSRVSKGELTDLNLNELIEDTLSFSVGRLRTKGIQVIKEYASELPNFRGEKTELQQVVLNIISNAHDALNEGGEFTIKTDHSDGRVIMEFSDNGIGIEKAHIDKVFDPFYTTKRPGKGTGLGLSLSYGIIEKHNGKMKVESEEGQGTKFIISLPAANVL